MERSIVKKTALVFGATGSIGQMLVQHFIAQGMRLSAVSQSATAAGQTDDQNLFWCQADISEAEQVQAVFAAHMEKWGRPPDLVVNAAALQEPIGDFWQVDPLAWDRTVTVNLRGSFLVLAEATRRMRDCGAGTIILFSGGGAAFSRPGFSAYAVSKAALLRLVENAADELAAAGLAGIRVFAVAPGAVRSRMTEEVLSAGERAGEKALQEARLTLASGGTDPAEITRLIDFLAGSDSAGLSGRLVHVREPYLQYATSDGKKIAPDLGKLRRIPL